MLRALPVIVNWNSQPYLDECLSALLATPQALPPAVVDNASTDDSLSWLSEQYPTVKLIALDENRGFGAGNNAAFDRLDASAYLLVNPDAVIAPGCIAALEAVMAAEPSIGIAGCRVVYPDGTLQHLGGFVDPPRATPRYALDASRHDVRDVPYVIGAAMCIRRAVLDAVGGFDEGFFLYFEETDLCRRAAEAGFRVVVVPDANVVHHESAVAGRDRAFYWRHFHAGRWRYLLKHYAPELVVAQTVPAEHAWLAAIGPHERRAVARSYRAVLSMLPEIWQRRAAEGRSTPDTMQRHAIADALIALRAAAWRRAPVV